MATEEATTKPAKKAKEKPKNLIIPPKKPKLSKAERRALQESQRAAKASSKGGGDQNKQQNKKQAAQPQTKKQPASKKTSPDVVDSKSISLFSHLPPYRGVFTLDGSSIAKLQTLHPAVVELGSEYAKGNIRGGNERCRAMLRCFRQVLRDYNPSDVKDYRQHLEHSVLKPSFNFWSTCRPHSVSMGNAFSFIKTAVMSLDRDVSCQDLVETLEVTLEAYVRERIEYADQAIAQFAISKINQGDVILVHGRSEAITVLLAKAAETIQFRVVIVDSRPLLEGKQTLVELRQAGIECTYILLNALSYILGEVTKVFLGASALMSDGSVLSRVGTGCVALMAHSANKPVLVCCETYKMSNRIQLESITGNELGNPQHVSSKTLNDWKSTDNLRLLNLLYDLTPAEFVSGIVTEMGILPPTSVAVLLREMDHAGPAS